MSTEQERKHQEESLSSLNERLDSAYDVASGGMGIYMHGLVKVIKNLPLPKWAQDALYHGTSNYLGGPYVNKWVSPDYPSSAHYGPFITCPDSDLHRRLIASSHEAYRVIGLKMIRVFCLGEIQDSAIFQFNLSHLVF